MASSQWLKSIAKLTALGPISRSAFRKYCRRNRGLIAVVQCKHNFKMETVIGDTVDNEIAVYGIYEPESTAVAAALASEVDGFIDVGCNIGYFSNLVASSSPSTTIVSIDANPVMVERTTKNLNLNSAKNAEVKNIGVGSKRDHLTLYVPEERHSLASLAYQPEKGGKNREIKVDVYPLSEILEQGSCESYLIKIDTEGFEPEVLKGISEESLPKIRYIMLELATANLQAAGYDQNEFLNQPLFQHFDPFIIDADSNNFLKPVTYDDLKNEKNLNTNILLKNKLFNLKKIKDSL